MKFEENNNAVEQQKPLDKNQEEFVPSQSQEEVLESKIQTVDNLANTVDDFSPAEISQIEHLGGNPDELSAQLLPIDEEIKRTKSGFIDRAKNYVIGLATMTASLANMNVSSAQEKEQDKKETNVVYVENKDDPRLQSYRDSLALYNNSLELKKELKENNYVLKKRSNSAETISNFNYDIPRIKNKLGDKTLDLRKEQGSLYSAVDLAPEAVNKKNKVRNLFSDKIRPIAEEIYEDKGESAPVFGKSKDYIYQKNMSTSVGGMFGGNDIRDVYDYSNVKPKVEVKLRQTSEITQEFRKVITPEKKKSKTESRIIYVEDQNDPKLKAYEDSLLKFKNSKYDYSIIPKNQKIIEEFDSNGKHMVRTIDNSVNSTSFSQYIELKKIYKKPIVEVKYRPKPKLSETNIKPLPAEKLKIEKQNPQDLLVGIQKKEIIRAPEKTGYTVRVGEKLYYLSKEDINKLEGDKTTYYSVSEKGDGTEKHLIWNGGNEQGQSLQQVADRLGVKLPIAFDTQEQKFDKE